MRPKGCVLSECNESKGFALIPILLIVILFVLGLGIFLLPKSNIIPTKTDSVVQLDKKGSCSIFGQTVKAPTNVTGNAFISAPTNMDAISQITPGIQTGDSRFTYLWIKDGKSVPVFAPADGVLVKIAYKARVDVSSEMSVPDYDLTFLTDCNTLYQINHITNPTPEISALNPNEQPLKLTKGVPINEQDTLPKQNITVKAGTQIGTTTGTPNAHNFDLGVFVNESAVCPYLKFDEPFRSDWLALLKGNGCDVSGKY